MKLIDFDKVDFYSPLIRDYLSGELKSKGLVNWDYSKDQLQKNKSRSYDSKTRAIVAEAIRNQYSSFDLTEAEAANLNLFEQENTFSITTGHQLVLLGGPLFFYSKILDVINLAKDLSEEESPVVPMFWMASEDHDFEEIAKVNLFGKVLECPGENKGPVGRITGDYFQDFLKDVNEIIGEGEQFQSIKSIINKAFQEGQNLSEITRIFVRELFKDEGLLIIDGDDKQLKELFTDVVVKELKSQVGFNSSKTQIEALSKEYKIQVNPREINLFYIEDDVRLRIVKSEDGFTTPDGEYNWSEAEMDEIIANRPQSISPNALLRPVYEEVLLPNIAYVGGAGEIAYWLELKPVFDAFEVSFPTPLIRKANFIIPEKLLNWLENNKLELTDLFGDLDLLVNDFAKSVSTSTIDLSEEENQLKAFYKALLAKGKSINPQLEKVVLGEEKRALGALKNVEKRFLNADKQNYEQQINKLKNIHSKFFPGGAAMERVNSYIPEIASNKSEFTKLLSEGSVFDKKIRILGK